MAPLQELSGSLVSDLVSLYAGTLKKRQESDSYPDLSDTHLLALMCISLSVASVSVIAALYAFYWFVRMRRSFRQDLIMLLIQSDMMKAMWLVICPIVYFADVPTNSKFCQVSGFFLTTTIEASDIAVLLIAVHTAIFILRRQHSGGSTGLYPYRRVAYALWAIVPIIMAAVVPLTGGNFVDNGPYCYLPSDPEWYISALSWIPRYIIFAIIIITYTGLYLYIGVRFRRFRRDQGRNSTSSQSSNRRRQRSRSRARTRARDVPPTPPIADHGLLNSVRSSVFRNGVPRDRQQSVASTVSTLQLGEPTTPTPKRSDQIRRNSIAWNVVDFGQDGSVSASQEQSVDPTPLSPTDESSAAEPFTTEPAPPIRAPEPAHLPTSRSSDPSVHSRSRWKHPLLSDGAQNITSSVLNIITALRRGPPAPSGTTLGVNASASSSSVHLPSDATTDAIRRSREKSQRQLSLLFAYPAIYLVTWIAPFVAHVMHYDDDYGSQHREPLPLQIVSLTSLCIGAAVDCCFFSAWEKPWLHLREGFWDGLATRFKLRSAVRAVSRIGGSGTHEWKPGNGGRTREEMYMDARDARFRREQENLDNLTVAAVARARSQRAHPRQWWDAVEADD
ncbi:G protein-coupled glucose receptor regulating Gpa2-domain-containing protein [Biscogniauxia mediterranea]|nr:G protein-coupled glucose receptor regulating Gpa2-domain-containing protein [Biscogniauxia mediterranea]